MKSFALCISLLLAICVFSVSCARERTDGASGGDANAERERDLYLKVSDVMQRMLAAENEARMSDHALASAYEEMTQARDRYDRLLEQRAEIKALRDEVAALQAQIQTISDSKAK